MTVINHELQRATVIRLEGHSRSVVLSLKANKPLFYDMLLYEDNLHLDARIELAA